MFKRWFSGKDGGVRLRVLMVCMGNICRSPMAEAVLRTQLVRAGLDDQVLVDSAGTLGQHRGEAPDPRAVQRAALRGYSLQGQVARSIRPEDFERFDLLLAMDPDNLSQLQRRCPPALQGRLDLLLRFGPQGADQLGGKHNGTGLAVPDPYYGSLAGFDLALDLIEPACVGLLDELRRRLSETAWPQS